jgi:hypothetical protein
LSVRTPDAEIQLSQGAKPSLGELLPAPRVSAEIAAARGVAQLRWTLERHPVDAVIVPERHPAVADAAPLLASGKPPDFMTRVALLTQPPVGQEDEKG